ncbi:hypothetical protein CONLIGDRAFT_56571 [Coniochaeta ligniaria NRRL 30616]|uniref:Uncharacterized protein n=1 Tax=Coniochaeta ligniaria NRRL 30616 TaxID=1408157 RepID=A0A1J7JPS1_9PEZI|nr:hypothetical protein CONLIGDRAFT_56571 [Coniochaeta ligniaria NRRL 30616]
MLCLLLEALSLTDIITRGAQSDGGGRRVGCMSCISGSSAHWPCSIAGLLEYFNTHTHSLTRNRPEGLCTKKGNQTPARHCRDPHKPRLAFLDLASEAAREQVNYFVDPTVYCGRLCANPAKVSRKHVSS